MSGVVAIVPLRDGRHGKTRLSSAFSGEQRGRLIAAMAQRVVHSLLSSGVVESVVMVTQDVEFVAQTLDTTENRLHIIAQSLDTPGLNAALDIGRDWAIARDAAGVLIVHADLPLLTASDVRELIDRDVPVVIAPDRHLRGTNALLLWRVRAHFPIIPEADTFVFRFGTESFAAHKSEARRRGLLTSEVSLAGTEVDLDTLGDWNMLPVSLRQQLGYDLTSQHTAVHEPSAHATVPGLTR